jgi:flagellar basal body-associated protein FliL
VTVGRKVSVLVVVLVVTHSLAAVALLVLATAAQVKRVTTAAAVLVRFPLVEPLATLAAQVALVQLLLRSTHNESSHPRHSHL